MSSEAKTVRNLFGAEVRVDRVNIEGVGRTKDYILIKMVQRLFRATNFEEAMVRVHEVRQQLQSLGAFKAIEVYVDTSKDSHDGLDVTYHVEERGRLGMGVNTMVGNQNDASIVIQVRAPNTFGRGESVYLDYQYGNKQTSGAQLIFERPILPWRRYGPKFSASLFQYGADAPWSQFHQIDRGLAADLTFRKGQVLQHTFRWETIWREIQCGNLTAFAVREEAGHTLKSSFKHILNMDWRDSPVIPSRGFMARLQQEFAGYLGPGNVGFHKHEIELQHNIPLFLRDTSLQGSFKAGFMRPNEAQVTCICDRFFLGGPLTLRGFDINGVGAMSEGSALGNRLYWVAAAHLYTPLPFLRTGGYADLFRLHAFLNGGNSGPFSFTGDHYTDINQIFSKIRYSFGAGLILNIGNMARFELNYCVPVTSYPTDKIKPGLQFGIGIHFV